jgi:DNA polymerase-3 subunit beta
VEFAIQNSEFLPVLQKCAHALETRTTIPILSTFLLTAEAGRLTVAATDLALAITSSVRCATSGEGKICLPGDKLLKIVQACKAEDQCVVKVSNATASILSGRSRFRVPGLDAKSYTEIPETPLPAATFDPTIFRRNIDRTKYAISTEESRFTLPGMLLELRDGVLHYCSTDGHRLPYVSHEFACESKGFKLILPKEAVSIAPSLFLSADHIEMSFDERRIWFSQGYDTVIAHRVTGNFSDFSRVLPSGHTKRCVVKAESLKESINRVSLCAARSKDLAPIITFKIEGGFVSLSASDFANSTEGEDIVEAEYDGAPFEVRLDGRYVLDGLNATTTKDSLILFTSEKAAIEFRPFPEDGWRYVVMPCHK